MPNFGEWLEAFSDKLQSIRDWIKNKITSPFGSGGSEDDSFSYDDFITEEYTESSWPWKKIAVAIVAVFCLSAGASYWFLHDDGSPMKPTVEPGEKVYFKVQPGMSAGEIAAGLEELGIIDNRYMFWLLAKFNGYEAQFKVGNYEMAAHMDMNVIFDKLIKGDSARFRFTIPEGFSVLDIARRLDKEGIVEEKEFLALAKDYVPHDYMKKGGDIRYAAEGFLFPDTYEMGSDATAKDILDEMSGNLDNRLTEDMRARAAELGLSVFDLMTMASLVEKEARYPEDRPVIAQVFFKRLKVGMPLQTDASLQYLLDAPKEDVSIADTKIDSPYNTYQHMGLPPGPIANPGMAAIEAVLHPADTDYLYFVADRQGHNHYAYSYDEHMDLVNEHR